jgi:hypothetical protein
VVKLAPLRGSPGATPVPHWVGALSRQLLAGFVQEFLGKPGIPPPQLLRLPQGGDAGAADCVEFHTCRCSARSSPPVVSCLCGHAYGVACATDNIGDDTPPGFWVVREATGFARRNWISVLNCALTASPRPAVRNGHPAGTSGGPAVQSPRQSVNTAYVLISNLGGTRLRGVGAKMKAHRYPVIKIPPRSDLKRKSPSPFPVRGFCYSISTSREISCFWQTWQ